MTARRLEPVVSTAVVVATSLAAVLLGIAILYVASFIPHPTWAKVVEELGVAGIVTGLVGLLLELRARRALMAEVLASTDLSQRVTDAGLSDVTADFLSDVDWKPLFEGKRELDLFFAYGGTWRANNIERLREVNRRKGSHIRVIMPDPQSEDTITDLARRFGISPEQVTTRINESIQTFEDLAKEHGAQAGIEVWLLSKTPMYSYYRFDDVVLVGMYHHRGIRSTVPAFTVKRGGTLFRFFESDISAMMNESNPATRIVFKKP